MTIATRHPRHSFRFRGRNFLALVLRPALPVSQWLGELDDWLVRSPGFFNGKPLILDLAGVALERADIAGLIGELAGRSIRIMGIEGVDGVEARCQPSAAADRRPHARGGRGRRGDLARRRRTADKADAKSDGKSDATPDQARPASAIAPLPSQPRQVPSLLIETPVRSGQAVINPDGDVIVLGSVASGAEVIAAGSIHVYGTLRGRALAGAYGNETARVFCRRYEAELIAIGEYFKAIEDIESELRQKPVQAWLAGGELKIAALDQPEKESGTWRKSS